MEKIEENDSRKKQPGKEIRREKATQSKGNEKRKPEKGERRGPDGGEKGLTRQTVQIRRARAFLVRVLRRAGTEIRTHDKPKK